jgi:ribosome-binding factor A
VRRRSPRLAAAIRRGVQEILARGLQDPRVSGLITVTSVRLTEDLDEALVAVSILPEERQHLVMHGLRAAQPHVRRELARSIDIRRTPRITFTLDTSAKRQAAVLRSLAMIAQEREQSRNRIRTPPEAEHTP